MAVTNYVWDGQNYLMETDESNVTTAIYTSKPEPFGRLISQRRGSTTSSYHYDGLGSTRALTDSSENVTDTYTYDAWGEEVTSTGTTTNPFRWVGELGYHHNSVAEDYYVRARTYSPKIGRWNSRDPSRFDGIDPETEIYFYQERYNNTALGRFLGRDPAAQNLYDYAGDNPAMRLDPSGMAWDEIVLKDEHVCLNTCSYLEKFVRIEKVPDAWALSPPWVRYLCYYEITWVGEDCRKGCSCPYSKGQTTYGRPLGTGYLPGLVLCPGFHKVPIPKIAFCSC